MARVTEFGSSPPTWGIRLPLVRRLVYVRFIPTYVGHTHTGKDILLLVRFIPTYVGHTKRVKKRGFDISLRFIPTYVGHTMEL